MPANNQMAAAVSRTASPTQGSSSRLRTSGRRSSSCFSLAVGCSLSEAQCTVPSGATT